MMHPVLRALFSAFDADELSWCLLRMPAVPEMPTGDVDILVAPKDLIALQQVSTKHGFVAIPGWDASPTLLLVRLDPHDATFLVLEVTDGITFADGPCLPDDLRDAVLSRSAVQDGARVPSPDDAFWLLLLHCVLDSGHVPEKYRERLVEFAASARDDGAIAQVVDRIAPPSWSAHRVRAATESADWADLELLAPELAASWRRERVLTAGARVRASGRRALRSANLLRRRYGVSVALLGPNGAGKSTLADSIEAAWPLPVTRIYMGLWKSGDGLAREIPVLAPLMRLPTAWARYLRGTRAQLRGELVVYDRYVHDARVPPLPPYVALKRVYLGVLARSVPDADVVLVLNLPGEVSHARKPEDTLEAAEREFDQYARLAAVLKRAHVLDASRPAAEVRAEAVAVVWERTVRRWRAPMADGRKRVTGTST